jgi:hypothetical protein
MKALNVYESWLVGLLVVASYEYFELGFIESVKMNGVEVLEYWTVVEGVMEVENDGKTKGCAGLFVMCPIVNGLI